MSETKKYKGYLVEIPLPQDMSVLDYAAGVCKEIGYVWDDGFDSALEYLEAANEYFYNSKSCILYKMEVDELLVGDSYVNMSKCGHRIDFETQFYDGGTFLGEMLEDGLQDLGV